MNSNGVIRRFQEARNLTGIQSRVAKRLGVSATHVNKVAIGERKSSRIMRALAAEISKIERQQSQDRAA